MPGVTQAAETGAPAGTSGLTPDRNLALELVRVTESAAMAAGRWIGRGDKISADQAAVDGMRHMLGTTNMAGVVVIGEGEKDEAPMLYNGEEIGSGTGPEVDVAVDPLEGTTLCAKGYPNAIATMSAAERGSMFFPGAAVYMNKIACGPEGADVVDIDAPPAENVKRVAKAKGVQAERRNGRRPRARPPQGLDRGAAFGRGAGAADPGRRCRSLDRRSPARHGR